MLRVMLQKVSHAMRFASEGSRRSRSAALARLALSSSQTGRASSKYFRREPPLKKISEPRTAAGRMAGEMRVAVVRHLCVRVTARSTYTP